MARKVNYSALSGTQRAQRREVLASTLEALRAALGQDEQDACEACGRIQRAPSPAQMVALSKQILELDGELRELDSAEEDSGRARLIELERANVKLKQELGAAQRRIDELERALNAGRKSGK